MVAWSARFLQRNSVDFFFKHYSQINNQTCQLNSVLFRALNELKTVLNLRAEVPDDTSQLAGTFSVWLNALPFLFAKAVFLIDGVDSIESVNFGIEGLDQKAGCLDWLPDQIPPNVRMLLSCSSDSEAYSALKGRNWPVFHLQILDRASREKLITNFMKSRGLRLPAGAMDRLIKRHQAKSPLFLVQILRGIVTPEDIKPSGSLGLNLFCRSIVELGDVILNNLENLPEMQSRRGLMEEFMSFIALSRKGLSEFELLDILQVPRALFSSFYLAARQVLKVCCGLLTFSHVLFLRAIERRFLSVSQVRRSNRLRLAEYFQSRPVSHRTTDELPWQLYQCRQWQDLATTIMNPHIFILMFGSPRGRFDLVVYWSAMLSGEVDVSELIAKCDNCLSWADDLSFSAEERLDLCFNIADLLRMLGYFDASLPFLRRATEIQESSFGMTALMTLKAKVRVAKIMLAKCDYTKAETIYESVTSELAGLIKKKEGERDSLEQVEREEALTMESEIGEDYLLLLWKSRFFTKLCKKCVSLLEGQSEIKLDGLLLLDSLVHAYIERGEADSANNLLIQCINVMRDAPREHQTQVISRSLGFLFLREQYSAIVEIAESFSWIPQELIGDDALQIRKSNVSIDILTTYGFALCQVGRADEAIRFLLRATDELNIGADEDSDSARNLSGSTPIEEAAEQGFTPAHVTDNWTYASTLMDLLAVAHRQLSYFTEAESFHKRSLTLKILISGSNDPCISYTVGEMAYLRECMRDEAAAIRLRKVAVSICQESCGFSSIVHLKSRLALSACYWKFGMFMNAEKHARTVLDTVQSRYGASHELVSSACLVLGVVQMALGKLSSAKDNLIRANSLSSGLWGNEHSDSMDSCFVLAQLHESGGDFDLAEEALLINRAQREAAGGKWSLGSKIIALALAFLYFRVEAFEEAEMLLREALPGVQKVHGPLSLDIACMLTVLSLIYGRLGNSEVTEQRQPLRASSDSLVPLSFVRTRGDAATLALRAYRIRRATLGTKSRHFLQHTIFTALLLEQISAFRFAEPLFRRAVSVLLREGKATLAHSLFPHYEACNRFGFSSDEWRPVLLTKDFEDDASIFDPLFDAIVGCADDDPSKLADQSFESKLMTKIPQKFRFLSPEAEGKLSSGVESSGSKGSGLAGASANQRDSIAANLHSNKVTAAAHSYFLNWPTFDYNIVHGICCD